MELIFYILILIPLISFVRGGLSLAPWIPAKKQDLDRIRELSDLKTGEIFYELGCGDARVCHFIAKKNPHVQVVGYEITGIMYLCAKIRLLFFPLPNLSILKKDIFLEDLSKADVLYVFGMKESTSLLRKKLQTEGKASARLISYNFTIPDAECLRKSTPKKRIGIYCYAVNQPY